MTKKENKIFSLPISHTSHLLVMDFKTYQHESKKTALYAKNDGRNWAYLTLGLVGEAGEVAEKMKKVIRDRGDKVDNETREVVKKEIGDVLWYMSQLCTELDISLDDVASTNIEKLFSRLERGKIHGSGDER